MAKKRSHHHSGEHGGSDESAPDDGSGEEQQEPERCDVCGVAIGPNDDREAHNAAHPQKPDDEAR